MLFNIITMQKKTATINVKFGLKKDPLLILGGGVISNK